jgi:rhamnosyltransferase
VILQEHIRMAGVVVLYNPDHKVLENISTYIEYIEMLIVVDNSDIADESLRRFLKDNAKVNYQELGNNIGVASALNLGCEIAIDRQFTHLLTMDQDSSFTQEAIQGLIKFAYNCDWNKIGIISPSHQIVSNLETTSSEFDEVLFTMTSGNILNLKAYQNVGRFLDWLFIDHIDHEYGMRLNKNGYKVLQINNLRLIHELGELREFFLGRFRLFSFISHSPLRTFYMIRNGLYVASLYKEVYPDFMTLNKKLTIKEVVKIFIENDKLKRIKYMLKALIIWQSIKNRV